MKRINLGLDGDLRDRHQQACIASGLAQSERLIQLLKADAKHWEKTGELLQLDFVISIADLIPRRFGVLRSMGKATGIDPHRLQALGTGELAETELTHEEVSEIAAYFNMPLEELYDLIGDGDNGIIQPPGDRSDRGIETLSGCNGDEV